MKGARSTLPASTLASSSLCSFFKIDNLLIAHNPNMRLDVLYCDVVFSP